ncbi:hypothetical protein SDC9_163618 [bioreactor metagenome]|uniref:Uncharacterized protein n=1 Tax=bioreactor metagenome TaxID=1076179 RepID=A0A645FQV5_9ZZZZ
MDTLAFDERVGILDVLDHGSRDRDHGIRILVGRLLDPARDTVAATQLFDLPRTIRFQGVRRDHSRDVLEQPGDDARELRIPGVRVDDVDWGYGRGHRHIGTQRPDGAVGAGGVVLGVGGGTFTGLAHALDIDAVTEFAQLRNQLTHMYASAAVDVRGVFSGEYRNAHALMVSHRPCRGAAEPEKTWRQKECSAVDASGHSKPHGIR